MAGRRRHNEAHGRGQEHERHEMYDLPPLAELAKALIEDDHELKSQNGLATREDHAPLFGGMGCLLFATFLLHVSSSPWRQCVSQKRNVARPGQFQRQLTPDPEL